MLRWIKGILGGSEDQQVIKLADEFIDRSRQQIADDTKGIVGPTYATGVSVVTAKLAERFNIPLERVRDAESFTLEEQIQIADYALSMSRDVQPFKQSKDWEERNLATIVSFGGQIFYYLYKMKIIQAKPNRHDWKAAVQADLNIDDLMHMLVQMTRTDTPLSPDIDRIAGS